MAAFDYIALDKDGKRRKGVIEADTMRHARHILRARLLAPMQVHEVSGNTFSRSGRLRFKNIGLRELSELTRRLAILIQSGVPVAQALQVLSRQNASGAAKAVLTVVRAQIMEGKSLAVSLAAFPGSFPKLFCASVNAAERSGHLGLVLGQLAEFAENASRARQKIMLALLYPAILTAVSLLIITFLMMFIVPDMIRVFTDTGQRLPVLTRMLIVVSDFTHRYKVLLFPILIVLGMIGRHVAGFQGVREAWDRAMLKLPVIGLLALHSSSARFAATLGMLQESGVPLLQALEITSEVMENSHLRFHVRAIAKKVSEGVSLSEAMEQSGMFPPVLVAMTGNGETSGMLGKMLLHASQISQRDVENRIALLLGVFEPLVLLCMGGIVLFLVLAIILPILHLNTLV